MKFYQAFLIFVSAIAGTGIFFTPIILTKKTGLVYHQIYFWLILGTLFLAYSFVFSRMIKIIPKKGGIYDYVTKLNRHLGFFAGWIEYFSIVVVAAFLLNLSLSTIIPHYLIYIISFVVLLLFTIIILRGAKVSIKTLTAFGSFTLLIFLIVFAYALFLFSKLTIFYVTENKLSNKYLTTLIAAIFETYAGVEILGYFSDRKNKDNLSKATIFGALILFIFYIIFSFLVILDTAFYGAFYEITFIGKILLILASLQMLGTVFAWMVSAPNLLYRMAEDENLPSIFKIKNKFNAPVISIIFTTFLVYFFVLTGFFEKLIEYYFILIIIIYMLVTVSYLKLERDYKGKAIYVLSAIYAILLSLSLLVIYNKKLVILVPLFIIAMSIYISRELHRNKKLVKYLHNFLTPLLDILWKFFVKKDIKLVRALIGDVNNKIILDFGAATGYISIYLAKETNSIIYASEISEKEANLIKKKIKKEKITNVVVEIDPPDRILEDYKEFFDVVIAYNSLVFLNNPSIFVKDLKRALKRNGIFIAIIYDKIFGIFEAPQWLKKIDKLLEKNGFSINIIKHKGRLWEKIIIIARRSDESEALH